MSSQDFFELMQAECPNIPETVRQRVVEFREKILAENEVQNLTRLLSPRDFADGHVRDVVELLKSGFISFPAMDLGSGGGVPGALAALFNDQKWVLAESEGRKSEFLSRLVREMGLSHVSVFCGRAELYLKEARVDTIVARAVGPVDRIYSWIRQCSTWNNLVLLKGPGWADEWKKFLDSRYQGELAVVAQHEYFVGVEQKKRIIIRLERRGRRR